MPEILSLSSQNRYEIEILNQMDPSWLARTGAADIHLLMIDRHPCRMKFYLRTDQAGLVGLIRQLHALGVLLVSVRQDAG